MNCPGCNNQIVGGPFPVAAVLWDYELEKITSRKNAGSIRGWFPIFIPLAKLESDVENIIVNIADIKMDIPSLRATVDGHFLIPWGRPHRGGIGLGGPDGQRFQVAING
jgi:hypothetical protein